MPERILIFKRMRKEAVLELVKAIDDYLKIHNTVPRPFVWTKNAKDIIKKLSPLYDRLS